MEKEKTIERLINKIRDKAKCFEACFKYLQEEENDTNDESIIDSFHVILLSYLKSIHSLLKEVREVIIWSLVNDKKEEFYSLGIAYSNVISCYKEYVDKELIFKPLILSRNISCSIISPNIFTLLCSFLIFVISDII